MYRHLLVSVDDTDRSVEAVSSGVALARSFGARVTFLHAAPDDAAAPHGAAEASPRSSAPKPVCGAMGRPRELLAKAEAAARALGVSCDAQCRVSERPEAAIVAAARERCCDLVVIAAPGHRDAHGAALDSAMLAALMSAGLPVHVTGRADRAAPAHAIGIMLDEHRCLAAVLHAWMRELAAARAVGSVPAAARMRVIARCLRAFALTIHHPKEEAHLFRRLRERNQALGAEIDELLHQHARDVEWLTTLARHVQALARAKESDAAAALGQLDGAVQAYAAFLWDHFGREEAVVLPAAQRHLTADDWTHIDAAYARNRLPATRADRERRRLFARIIRVRAVVH